MKRRRYPGNLTAVLALLAVVLIVHPLFAAPAGKPIRTGLWVTQKLPVAQRDQEELDSQLRQNHNLSGVCLHIPWNEIEKASGQPDFAAIDKTVAVFRRNNVKYQLCFKPGAFTPDFVFSDGAKAFETEVRNPHRANFGSGIRIPVPWDPIYQNDFSRTIKRLGDKYADDPLCVSVVLTCANYMSAEMHLPKDRSEIARWRALGDYASELLGVYKKFTDTWATAFPKQEISLHISKVLDLPPSFQERIIDYGLSKYPERFSIQSCQLTGRKEDTGVMTYDLVQKYRDRAHHGFQSLAGLNGQDGRMGSPEMAALNLVHANAEYWELWHGDGFGVSTSTEAARAWQEAKDLGYDAYKKKLIAEGKYRER
jgi:hypothetical protein